MSFLRTLYLRGISYGIVCSVLSSAAIEIIPGVGLESDCHVGMAVDDLKEKIYAVDERWGAWYLNQGEIRVVHDGANVLKLFFTCHINNMPDDPFTPKEPFMGSVRGLTNSMQNILLHRIQIAPRPKPYAAATYIKAKKECQKHAQSYKYSCVSSHR